MQYYFFSVNNSIHPKKEADLKVGPMKKREVFPSTLLERPLILLLFIYKASA